MSSSSPPSRVQEAREALGKRLREIRKDSGLTARALAAAAGWHESKSSRLENGRTPPSDEDIRVWTRICHAEEEAPDLIATARGIDGMYIEWRRLESAGLKRVQESVLPLFERTGWFRFYQSQVVPGLLQTQDYTRAVLHTVVAMRQTPDDKQVSAELVSAGLTVTQPREIAEYAKTFSELAGIAVHGASARKLITSAIDALG
ncbi:helix-turn-helix domain-containing protein [Streptomyces sp. NPDC001739]